MTKSVLITGCSSGIGLCAARGLRARGYHVIATARKAEDVARLSGEGFDALQLDLDEQREAYRPLSVLGSRLFILLREFFILDPMYRFSLGFFTAIFNQVLS